jgi:hypothetical protein
MPEYGGWQGPAQRRRSRSRDVWPRAAVLLVAHWYVLHVPELGAALWMGVTWQEFDFARAFAGLPRPLDFTLPGVYAVAAAAVAFLFLPCHWIGELKQRNRAAWTRFI